MAVTKPEVHRLISKVNFSDSNRKPEQIKYLVKHYVGATGGAEANCKYFYDKFRGASSHFFVGHNGEIWQCVEENDTAWHCGTSGKYKHKECRNSNSIGVELCVKKDANGNWYYTEETKKAAVQLFAYLMDKYHIDADHVLRHYDVTGKNCGEPDVRKGNKEWSQFKKDIVEYGKEAVPEQPTAPEQTVVPEQPTTPTQTITPEQTTAPTQNAGVPYTIVTTCDSLKIRSGASTIYKVVGRIRESEGRKKEYTIVEEKNGWGKLKSGAGWISLAYTKRV